MECVHSAVYGAVNYKEPLRSFEIREGHSPGFGFPSVVILPQCAESNVKQYTYSKDLTRILRTRSIGIFRISPTWRIIV